ncbi:hypothetical protein CMU71_14730 [Elizabethkingia anophelis]|nr:hypothetical protein [Elizabethkingia anophelis]
MDKLTIQELAPYIPYSVHLMNEYGNCHNTTTHRCISLESMLTDYKMCLRPISDLTKEITHNGETFIPLHRILESYCFNLSEMDEEYILSFKESLIDVDISYNTVKMLCEWHFDFQDLIGRGLAINLNEVDNGK